MNLRVIPGTVIDYPTVNADDVLNARADLIWMGIAIVLVIKEGEFGKPGAIIRPGMPFMRPHSRLKRALLEREICIYGDR